MAMFFDPQVDHGPRTDMPTRNRLQAPAWKVDGNHDGEKVRREQEGEQEAHDNDDGNDGEG
eukprot:2436806-Pyramimonas_sp.AAC.1